MNNEKKSQSRIWIQIPENFSSMNEEEIESFTQSLWQKITQQLGDADESWGKTHLLQLAYKRWIIEYPSEEMDQID